MPVFFRQVGSNDDCLGFVRAGLTGFRTSAFTGFTCTGAFFASMAGIFLHIMIMPVDMGGNPYIFGIDEIPANVLQLFISAAGAGELILWNLVLMDNNGKVSNNLFLCALLPPLVTRDFNGLRFNRLRNGCTVPSSMAGIRIFSLFFPK